jgi:branched-chain amino acid aminotransferase
MAQSNKEPVVYIYGELVPASQAHIAIFDLAVVLGATVTDMSRTFKHEPFRLDDHVNRFYRSCKYARIAPPISAEETEAKTRELIAHNAGLIEPDQELGVIYFISPGQASTYAGAAGATPDMKPTFCIHSFPLPFQLWRKKVAEGFHVVTPSTRHVPPICVDPKIKNRSRLHFWIADQETHAVDADAMTLLLDLDGNVTETSGSNFIIVRDGQVISPSRRNILGGISLATVRDLCGKLGIPFVERDFQVYDIINADEAMLPSTPYCMAPATKVNNVPIGDGKPGPVYAKLMAAWSELVGIDILEQINAVSFG